MITKSEISQMKKIHSFQNIISLGHFCAPAMQLEKFGFRKSSYPFDWLIIRDFVLVLQLIKTGYDGTCFLKKEFFAQAEKKKMYYKNIRTSVRFLHDFDAYRSLDMQWDSFQDKYIRRMNRFQEAILTPTLFIRYVGGEDELNYISNNIELIDSVIKEKCNENEIIYVCDKDLNPRIDIVVTNTDKDFDFMQNSDVDLLKWIRLNYASDLSYHKHKTRKISKLILKLKAIFVTPYQHSLTYKDLD